MNNAGILKETVGFEDQLSCTLMIAYNVALLSAFLASIKFILLPKIRPAVR